MNEFVTLNLELDWNCTLNEDEYSWFICLKMEINILVEGFMYLESVMVLSLKIWWLKMDLEYGED